MTNGRKRATIEARPGFYVGQRVAVDTDRGAWPGQIVSITGDHANVVQLHDDEEVLPTGES